MKNKRENILIIKEEYNFLMNYLSGKKKGLYNKIAAMRLRIELLKATQVDKKEFPDDVVKINSTVIVKNIDTNRVKTYTLVMPEKANHQHSKVSILSPIGTALLGFRKGFHFTWKHFSSKENLAILEVYNSPSLNIAYKIT
jgi:regulator of nucleoside diphosphate kinase